MQTSTLRPGFLVSLKTSVRGNVSYQRKDIEAEHKTEDGKAMARWETERVIADATEHDAAIKARTKARVMVTSVCTASAFGLLCPESAAEELEKAIEGARQVAESFNAEAKLTRLSVYVITGRIAQDDVEAVKAINSEIRDLLSDMQEGIGNCDAKAVREAATKARSLGSMLSFDAAAKVQKGLRVFVRDETPLDSIERRLSARGDGEVSLVVILGPKDGEVEIRLPGRYAVSAAVAGALKAAPGVVAVEQV